MVLAMRAIIFSLPSTARMAARAGTDGAKTEITLFEKVTVAHGTGLGNGIPQRFTQWNYHGLFFQGLEIQPQV